MLEWVLMRAFLLLYSSDIVNDAVVGRSKSRSAERRAFRLLTSVCWYWHQTVVGWPESPTSQWLRHQIKKQIERKSTHSSMYYVLY